MAVTNGTLLVGTQIPAPVTITGGALGGWGSVGEVTSNGGTLLGTDGDTLKISNLSMDANSQLNVALGTHNSAPLFYIPGDLETGGTINITDLGGLSAGTYILMLYTGNATGTPFTIGSTPNGIPASNYSVTTTNGAVALNVSAGQSPPILGWHKPSQRRCRRRPIRDLEQPEHKLDLRRRFNKYRVASPPTSAGHFAVFSEVDGEITVDNSFRN